jgi:hypothetical protein
MPWDAMAKFVENDWKDGWDHGLVHLLGLVAANCWILMGDHDKQKRIAKPFSTNYINYFMRWDRCSFNGSPGKKAG